ncbi:SIR2 family protein [Arthrobacter sp. UYCu723]
MSAPDEPLFRRSTVEFFHSRQTKSAIDKISNSRNLIIYCGAGTTIDRTGLSWGALIAEIFKNGNKRSPEYPTDDEIDLLISGEDSPMRVASILTQYAMDDAITMDALANTLGSRLAISLYKRSHWSSGSLVEFIARLATGTSMSGKQVTVITTNYDTLIEDAVKIILDGDKSRHPTEPIGLNVIDTNLQARELTDGINLAYLHGRVNEDGGHRGRLVLSEIDYQETHDRSVKFLASSFRRPNTAVLILGSSLTDPPLVEALSISRKKNRISKFAIMPIQATKYAQKTLTRQDTSRSKKHIMRRGELLGLNILIPDFYFQIAQFCLEADLVRTVDSVSYDAWSDRYGQRLLGWWSDWKDNFIDVDFLNNFAADSRGFLDELRRDFLTYNPDDIGEDESLRLELWVREDPSARRGLSLVASSAGYFTDESVLRREEFSLYSANASLRAFQDGRVQHTDASRLLRDGKKEITSRWRSYLCVPIRVQTGSAGSLPVGVITLSSTRSVWHSGLPSGRNETMAQIVRGMAVIGQELLQPDDA